MAKEPKAILCPYCGLMQPQPSSDSSATAVPRCSACGGLFDPLSRKATQIAMGPWFIRDRANPFRPGCCWEVLKRQIEAGRIKPTTVIRGPTTRQFWAIARNVPGVGHLLGYCHRCGTKVNRSDVACPECAEPFIEPNERNELGLMFASKAAAEAAYKQLEKEIDGEASSVPAPAASGSELTGKTAPPPPKAKAAKEKKATASWEPGLDLLDEVIGESSAARSSATVSASSSADQKTEASARKTKFESAPTAVKLGAALDFGPSEAEQTATEPATAPPVVLGYVNPSRSSQFIVWLLLALNLLLLPILIGALLYFMGVFSTESPANQPSPRSSLFDESLDQPRGAEPALGPSSSSDGMIEVIPVPRPRPKEGESSSRPAEPPAATVPPPPPRATVDPVVQAMAQAREYENAGDLTRALTLLQDIQAKTRPADQPAELETRIQQIQEKIQRAQAAKFFGVPAGQ